MPRQLPARPGMNQLPRQIGVVSSSIGSRIGPILWKNQKKLLIFQYLNNCVEKNTDSKTIKSGISDSHLTAVSSTVTSAEWAEIR